MILKLIGSSLGAADCAENGNRQINAMTRRQWADADKIGIIRIAQG
jgi:hypothetical protein